MEDKEFGEFLIKIGLKISYYRKLRNLSQEKLAEKVKLSRVTIAHIEAPDMYYRMKISTIYKIAKALDVPVIKLFDFQDD